MPEFKEPALNFWYRALHSEDGIELLCSDVTQAKAKLYRARDDAKDPDLMSLSLSTSPFDASKLWIRRATRKRRNGVDNA